MNAAMARERWADSLSLRNHPLRYLVISDYNLRERAGYTASEVLWLAAKGVGRVLVAVEAAAGACQMWGGA